MYHISIFDRSDLVNDPIWDGKYYNSGLGLSNQIFKIITGIMHGVNKGYHEIVIDSFSCCMLDHSICPIEYIIDLKNTSTNINDIMGYEKVVLSSRKQFPSKWDSTKTIDMCHGSWYTDNQTDIFLLILKSIVWNSHFYKIADDLKPIQTDIMIAHIRLEDDAIKHWSRMNNMSPESYNNLLMEKYIDLLKKSPCSYIFTLSSDIPHKLSLIEKLSNKKIIRITDSDKDKALINTIGVTGREIRALVDMVVTLKVASELKSQSGKNVFPTFIGNHNFRLSRGSSFSYIISCLINGSSYNIDLDDISQPVSIIHKKYRCFNMSKSDLDTLCFFFGSDKNSYRVNVTDMIYKKSVKEDIKKNIKEDGGYIDLPLGREIIHIVGDPERGTLKYLTIKWGEITISYSEKSGDIIRLVFE